MWYVWEYGNVRATVPIWEFGNVLWATVPIWEFGNVLWEYGNVVCKGIWECEGYSTHIFATAELVFSAYIIFYYY